MAARILDGKAIAAKVRGEVAQGVARFREAHGRPPGLDVVLVGEDLASRLRSQQREGGQRSRHAERVHRLAATATAAEILALIDELNHDDRLDGFLVQLPLPKALPETTILDAVSPAKDVDGFIQSMPACSLSVARSSHRATHAA